MSNDNIPRAHCGETIPVDPGEEIHTRVAYCNNTGAITLSISASGSERGGNKMRESKIVVNRPFPNEEGVAGVCAGRKRGSYYSSWKEFFLSASNGERENTKRKETELIGSTSGGEGAEHASSNSRGDSEGGGRVSKRTGERRVVDVEYYYCIRPCLNMETHYVPLSMLGSTCPFTILLAETIIFDSSYESDQCLAVEWVPGAWGARWPIGYDRPELPVRLVFSPSSGSAVPFFDSGRWCRLKCKSGRCSDHLVVLDGEVCLAPALSVTNVLEESGVMEWQWLPQRDGTFFLTNKAAGNHLSLDVQKVEYKERVEEPSTVAFASSSKFNLMMGNASDCSGQFWIPLLNRTSLGEDSEPSTWRLRSKYPSLDYKMIASSEESETVCRPVMMGLSGAEIIWELQWE